MNLNPFQVVTENVRNNLGSELPKSLSQSAADEWGVDVPLGSRQLGARRAPRQALWVPESPHLSELTFSHDRPGLREHPGKAPAVPSSRLPKGPLCLD